MRSVCSWTSLLRKGNEIFAAHKLPPVWLLKEPSLLILMPSSRLDKCAIKRAKILTKRLQAIRMSRNVFPTPPTPPGDYGRCAAEKHSRQIPQRTTHIRKVWPISAAPRQSRDKRETPILAR